MQSTRWDSPPPLTSHTQVLPITAVFVNTAAPILHHYVLVLIEDVMLKRSFMIVFSYL